MATVAHCLFCFDVLASSLQKKKPLSLAHVQDLWTAFELEKEKEKEKEKDTTVQIHDGENDSEYTEEDLASAAMEEEIEQVTVAAATTNNKTLLNPTSVPSIRFPGISRLRDLSGSSSSSSSGSSSSLASGSRSNSSTPSTLSTASSRSVLTDNTPGSSSAISAASVSSSVPPASGSGPGSSSRRLYNFLSKREEEYPLFVTWNAISVYSGTKSLRGCIGTFDPTELSVGLKNYALTAAFDDTRFSPISSTELPSLSVTVTLLLNFHPASSPLDWIIGTHGLRISFSYHGRRYHSTYLPDVAEEQGWTQEETLVSLMRKAGWTGRSGEWKKVADLKVVTYEGVRVSASWGSYEEWRRWVDGR